MLLNTTQLAYRYSGAPTLTFPDISLDKGQSLLVLGPSGVGKSTLLNLLALLLPIQEGSIEFMSNTIHTLKANALPSLRAQNIGLIHQTAHFVASHSVAENISLNAYLAKKPLDQAHTQQLAQQLGLAPHWHKKWYELSVGQQQRASIARALALKPALVLADEPTASLDKANAQIVADLLLKHCAQQDAGLIVVTHDERLLPYFNQTIRLS
jgi:ABC-type lipoprotein export system ATPase subunit